MNIASDLERAAHADGNHPALAQGDHVVVTYAELAARVARLAGGLLASGLKAGDRVAVMAKNSPAYLETLYAIWHAGLVAVPANAKLHGAELGYILEHSGARLCFASDDLAGEIGGHAPASLERLIMLGSADHRRLLESDAIALASAAPDDLAWLFYTSGTTGKPKGAMLTHRNLTVMSEAYCDEVDAVSPGDPVLHAAPMSHGSGLYILPHVARGGVNVVPESAGFEPEEVFSLLRRWPRSSMFAAPTMIKRLVESPADCPAGNIRNFVWGGAPMYVEDAVRALDRSDRGSRRSTGRAKAR